MVRGAAASARWRRQRRCGSEPAARLLGKITSAAAGRQLARLDHFAVLGFFPDAADGAWRRPVARRRPAVAKTGRDRSGKTVFRLGAAAPARPFGALSARPPPDRRGVRRPDGTGGTDAGLAAAARTAYR